MRMFPHALRLPTVLASSLFAALSATGHSAQAQAPGLDTVTAIDGPVCALYHGSPIDLVANLTDLANGLPLAGRLIDFKVGGVAAGSGTTDADGMASYPFNVNSLTAGDYTLRAAFLGDGTYNGSSDETLLGISYTFVGFQPPLGSRGQLLVNPGRALPVKIRLVDANLAPVPTASPTVWIHQWSPGTGLGARLAPPTSVGAANIGNTMRYSPMDQQYIFNLDTRDLAGGGYAVLVELGDSEACSSGPYFAPFTVGKRGK